MTGLWSSLLLLAGLALAARTAAQTSAGTPRAPPRAPACPVSARHCPPASGNGWACRTSLQPNAARPRTAPGVPRAGTVRPGRTRAGAAGPASALDLSTPIVKGSGSTAASELTRAALTNASATGNAQMSLTYDSVGSGQGARRAPPRGFCPGAPRGPRGRADAPGARLFTRAWYRAPLTARARAAGQKNLLQNAYDYCISDVPLSEAVYNSSSKCGLRGAGVHLA
jgi:hypothetical protein